MFINVWPILTLCVADMVHAVANVVCGPYRCFPMLLSVPRDGYLHLSFAILHPRPYGRG